MILAFFAGQMIKVRYETLGANLGEIPGTGETGK